jgi:flagellar assembly protein FliH
MSSSTDTVRPVELTGLAGLRLPELRTVETTHEAARAQGYAVGWAQGRREAEASARAESAELARTSEAREAQRDAEVAAAVAALHEAARASCETVAEACRRVDEQAGALALELTRALVGATTPDPAHVLDRVLGLLPEHAVATVHLHPSVAALADGLRDQGLAVVADPSLAPGDAVAQADDHVVDLRVDEALHRLAEVLG